MATKNNDTEMQKDKLKALINNRMGVLPDGASFTVASTRIEDTIIEYLEEKGVDVRDNKDIIVRAIWNNKFESSMKTGRPTKEDPFHVIVAIHDTDKKTKHVGGFIGKLNRIADANSKLQLRILGDDKLNNVVSTLAKKDKNGDIHWIIDEKDSKWPYCYLDIFKVMQYCCEDENNKNVVYDFYNRKKCVDRVTGRKYFTCSFYKFFEKETFKNKNRNVLAFLNNF